MRVLMNLHPTKLDKVMFGKGEVGEVLAKGNLRVPRMPKLKDVLLVGLKSNLIGIN